ncbi:MAG: DUF309 domain-containing protein [Alicyclobacillaceae bacterium]|nr:DUF309 domain-containing protein [Alicyclobacillaceae bacterium]
MNHRDNDLSDMDDRFLAYLYCFCVLRDYFLCHEYGESLWLSTGRNTVLKGFIQGAVCLYHLENGNVRGARRMWTRARKYLLDYVAQSGTLYSGISIPDFVAQIEQVFTKVPPEWFGQRVERDEVHALRLPKPTLSLSPGIRARFAEFTLPPLHDDEAQP